MPARIGKYSGLELIGKGATATVYLAQHPDLRQPRAIKVFETGRAPGPDGLLPEAVHQAGLRHRRILEVYDQDIDAQTGRMFLVMEYAPFGSLRGLLDKGPLDGAAALGLAAQIAEGLEAAHAAGICHLDIKPENILLRAPDDVAIGDFGLAVEQGRGPGGHPGGTPNYMAPEQIQGSCGPACDIWALGAVVFEMLGGCLCYEGEDRDTVIQAVLGGPGDIAARLRRLGCVGPPGVANLLHRMMEIDPAARLNAADAARELAAMARRAEERAARNETGAGIPTEAGQWQCKNCGQPTPWGMDLCLDCVDKTLVKGVLDNNGGKKSSLWLSLAVAACCVLILGVIVAAGAMRWREELAAQPAIALVEPTPAAQATPVQPKDQDQAAQALVEPGHVEAMPEPSPTARSKAEPAPKAAPVTKRATLAEPVKAMSPKVRVMATPPASGTIFQAMTGSGTGAEAMLRDKLRAQPGHTGASRNLALLLMEQRRYGEALKILSGITRRHPGDAEARQAMAIARRLKASGNL